MTKLHQTSSFLNQSVLLTVRFSPLLRLLLHQLITTHLVERIQFFLSTKLNHHLNSMLMEACLLYFLVSIDHNSYVAPFNRYYCEYVFYSTANALIHLDFLYSTASATIQKKSDIFIKNTSFLTSKKEY